MTAWRRLALPFAAVLAQLLAVPLHAQEAPGAESSRQQALYQEALQALAEGRKQDASEALTRLIEQEPQHAGAWLDLALIQCGLGKADEAERLFAHIETRFNPSRDILELIAETREAGCHRWQPVSSVSVLFGRGMDQNVNQGASTSTLRIDNGQVIELPLLSDFLPKRDQYSVMSVDYMREVTANGSLGFAQLQQRRNDQLHDYDTGSLFAGIESPWRFGSWTARTTGMLGAVSLGGKFYQRQLQLQAQVTPPLPLPANTQFSLIGNASHTDYLTLANFNSNLFELRGQLTHRRGPLLVTATVGASTDHARDARPGGDRHGSFASVLLKRPLWGDLAGELGYSRQTWDSAAAYSPELLITQVRAQDTQVLRGTLSYRLARNQTVQLEGRVVRNKENISIFQYNNRLLQLSWQWQYP
ncbi:MAG: tetratricopeptide repeat protein [Massilia sp.]